MLQGFPAVNRRLYNGGVLTGNWDECPTLITSIKVTLDEIANNLNSIVVIIKGGIL